jgi:hypothetical protein
MQTALTRRKEAAKNSAEIHYRCFYSPFPKDLSQYSFIFPPPTTARIYAMLTSKPALDILNRFFLFQQIIASKKSRARDCSVSSSARH